MPLSFPLRSVHQRLSFIALFFCLALSLSTDIYALSYRATIDGIDDAILFRQCKEALQVIINQPKGVASIKQLKNSANNDCDILKKIAFYNGFFSCSVTPMIAAYANDIDVVFQVQLGPKYTLRSLKILWTDKAEVVKTCPQELVSTLTQVALPSIDDIPSFQAGSAAEGNTLLSFERELLTSLAAKGFTHPTILSKQFIAYPDTASIDAEFEVQTGPLVRFGPISIIGTTAVKDSFIQSRLIWHKSEIYDGRKVESTEAALQKTGLFQSIEITPLLPSDIKIKEPYISGYEIPIQISVIESKHRTIGAGVSYTTTFGAGCSLELDHRNIRGIGTRLSFRADVWQKMRKMTLTYTIPHWKKQYDNTLFILEHDHQIYLPYHSSSINVSLLRERRLTQHLELIWGARAERLESTKIISNKLYHLIKSPFQIRWSNTNSPLDPLSGISWDIKVTPSYQFRRPHFFYVISQSTWSGYTSIYRDSCTLATKLSLGSILGAGKNVIPIPDRFFAGTENSLRGYKTGTVAPLNREREPVGGRSIATATFEIRHRYKNGLGSVVFYDVGNVFYASIPNFNVTRFFNSVGIGLRYQTPIGPLRIDVGIPLNRRKNIDPIFQIYFSIGQAF